MKTLAAVVCLTGVAGLALGVGSHIPPDTVAVTVGVIVGAFASIPISLALGVVLGRKMSAPAEAPQPQQRPVHYAPPYSMDAFPPARGYPPVVIINPAPFQSQGVPVHPVARLDAVPLLGVERKFTVIGDETTR